MNRTSIIHRVLSGKANGEEITEIETWIAKDPANKLEFEDIRLLWEYSNIPVEKELSRSDFQYGLLKIENTIGFLKRKRRRAKFLKLISIVVAMLILMIAVFLFYSFD